MNNRIEYVDIFRGVALLIMITIQIFDQLSTSNIYTSSPYYVETINSVTWVPPSLLFTFVSGMGIFLWLNKRIKKKVTKKGSIIFSAIKRYGKYILISLPFTIILWDLNTYLQWNEAIQGIGITVIFTTLYLLLISKYLKNTNSTSFKTLIIFTIIVLAFLQSLTPSLIDSKLTNFPREVSGFSINSIISMVLNALFRGWFSVINLLPIMLGGILLISFIQNDKPNTRLLLFSFSFLLASIFLHILGYKIDYYGRSFALTFFAVGQSSLICSLIYIAYRRYASRLIKRIFSYLKVFGLTSFFVYIAHYLLIIKVLQLTKLNDLLSDLYGWILTIPLIIFTYLLAKQYLKIQINLHKHG